jgi:2-polyprenyl-3-methyl-5-hydroxy-6-metoxy-1,4-benzoquinol methylase
VSLSTQETVLESQTSVSAVPVLADVETASEDYARRFAGPVGEWFLRIQEQAVLRMLSPWPGATVLDVGGGHGQLTGALSRHGYQVTVVGSHAACRERISEFVRERRCQFEVANFFQLPYPARLFDVVLSVRLLPHVEAWSDLIGEMARAARYAVIVDYPTTRSLNCLTPMLFGAKRKLEGNTRTYRSFREADIVSAFAAHGFGAQVRYPQFFLPMVMHRVMRQPGLSAALEGSCRAIQLTRWFGSPVIQRFSRERSLA